jgi:hypothetical protein
LLLAVLLINALLMQPLPLLLQAVAQTQALTLLPLRTKGASRLAVPPRIVPLPLSKPVWLLAVAPLLVPLPRPL